MEQSYQKFFQNQTVFEISWEVCNKVGGIFTVISSKADLAKQYIKNYFMVGPYFEEQAQAHFTEETPPAFLKPVCKKVKQLGLRCHFGHWLVKGEPKVILVDFANKRSECNQIKEQLYQDFKIDSWSSPKDFDEVIVWSYCVGLLLDVFAKQLKQKFIVHGHEWHSGPAILMVKQKHPNIPTIFTTHSTVIGRTLANNNQPLYEILDKIKPLEQAYQIQCPSQVPN